MSIHVLRGSVALQISEDAACADFTLRTNEVRPSSSVRVREKEEREHYGTFGAASSID